MLHQITNTFLYFLSETSCIKQNKILNLKPTDLIKLLSSLEKWELQNHPSKRLLAEVEIYSEGQDILRSTMDTIENNLSDQTQRSVLWLYELRQDAFPSPHDGLLRQIILNTRNIWSRKLLQYLKLSLASFPEGWSLRDHFTVLSVPFLDTIEAILRGWREAFFLRQGPYLCHICQ